MRRLVVFDVDGTLTQTMDLEARLFPEAARLALGIEDADTDWASYRHVTDTGVTAELVERRLGRPARGADIDALRARYVELLRAALAAGTPCRPVPGAAELLEALRGRGDLAAAVATGAWRDSALLKTRAAGLDLDALPMATGDDAVEREAILELAVERGRAAHGLPAGVPAVFVGDGVWDLTAARRVGVAFVGVGTGPAAERLRAAGARRVVADFTDRRRILELLAVA